MCALFMTINVVRFLRFFALNKHMYIHWFNSDITGESELITHCSSVIISFVGENTLC